MRKKVMVGMSGGVDSSVAAFKLKEMGFDVTGATMNLKKNNVANDIDDAKNVCRKIGIDHIVMDFSDLFAKKVIDYFVESYKNGLTPNPCVACNKNLKFGAFMDKAVSLGFDFIATGHYASTGFDDTYKRYLLYKSSSAKDQSYMLYSLSQGQLEKTIFPLANMEKSCVREIAKQNGLAVADKPDSQDICFVTNNNYVNFIQTYTGEKLDEGNFVDSNGNVLGKHKGVINYTIGQRKGIGLPFEKPMYVVRVDACNNIVVLGEKEELYSRYAAVKNVNFILFYELEDSLEVKAKVRYNAEPCDCTITKKEGKIVAEFKSPQRAVTPGQSIVFYKDNIVVGGGEIDFCLP